MRDLILGGSSAPERPAAGSTVPEFRAVHLTEGWAVVTCPRKSCGGTFEVNRALWESSNLVKVRTRPCPYCFRVGWLPGEKPGAEPKAEPVQPKRRSRVVKLKKTRPLMGPT